MLAARGLRAARSRRPAPSPRRAAAGAAASAAPPTPAGSGAAKLWGGRFSGGVDPLMEKFNESLSVDRRMAAEDCAGSRAYARALARAGLLSAEEASALVEGLAVVEAEWASNSFVTRPGDEDVHTANERRLGELVGPVAGKLHTGRSRNDQVATDTRLWLLTALRATRRTLRRLLTVAADRAEAEADALLPGYTHLQPAQPVRWSHWLLAHASAWRRDDERLGQLLRRVAVLPLGSGALAGHAFGLDRSLLASELGFFGGACTNSMDGVSDRDYVCEAQFWASLVGVHLSRFAEDLIIYSTPAFGFVSLSDGFSTGSSLMPQKRNPDSLELLRGKAGRLLGNLTGTMAVLKGTPSCYNKDFQECWAPLFESVDAAGDCLAIAAGALSSLSIDRPRMAAALSYDMLATDLAEYLVRKGVPFRETHHVAGAAVRAAEAARLPLSALPLATLVGLHPAFGEDVAAVWSFERSAQSRDALGGTSLRSIALQVAGLRAYLATELEP